jgi:hypothetical protein
MVAKNKGYSDNFVKQLTKIVGWGVAGELLSRLSS